MKSAIIQELRRAIEESDLALRVEKIGSVAEVRDGICRILGLAEAASGEMIEIETVGGPVNALVFNLEEEAVGAVLLGDYRLVREGDRAKGLARTLSIPVGREMIGRVINALGEPLDGKGAVFSREAEYYPVERSAPGVIERAGVDTPLMTGVTAIDAMIPIGRGQRELLIGDRQTGKTAIAVDAIINQGRDSGRRTPVCIYCAVGQKESKIAQTIQKLEEAGAMTYTIVVAAPASAPAALAYLAPFAATAVGEYFMHRGEDALVVYDDLSKQAWAYRELSLLLRRPPGREAYPGDIFYLHARLLERAARLSPAKGGGSLTALPIIETQLGDVSAYIPTNVISITDGQIYLEPELFYQGVRPAVNAGLSVSRVGSDAQTKAMKKVAGRLRLELAQFRELAAFAQFAADLDKSTKARLARGRALTEILKQPALSPVPLERQVIMIFAGTRGLFDALPEEAVTREARVFVEHVEAVHGLAAKEIRENGAWSEEIEKTLEKAVGEFRLELVKRYPSTS